MLLLFELMIRFWLNVSPETGTSQNKASLYAPTKAFCLLKKTPLVSTVLNLETFDRVVFHKLRFTDMFKQTC